MNANGKWHWSGITETKRSKRRETGCAMPLKNKRYLKKIEKGRKPIRRREKISNEDGERQT
jgi:hypothetical protein